MRIAMWSGPRNLSTAMMYAFAARSDCAVIDEPFYAAYLHNSGEIHPMQEEILAAQPVEYKDVVAQCLGDYPHGKAVFYQKQMTHHMLPDTPMEWLADLTNVFLIRHPARVVASYQRKRENPKLEDIGFIQQVRIFEQVKAMGLTPVVVDSDDILQNPGGMLAQLCKAIGLEYEADMLHWQPGGNAADGVWAPHWYESVWSSSGLQARTPDPLPVLSDGLEELVGQAMPSYVTMANVKITEIYSS